MLTNCEWCGKQIATSQNGIYQFGDSERFKDGRLATFCNKWHLNKWERARTKEILKHNMQR